MEPGWFSVDIRGLRFGGIDQIESLRLAGPGGMETGPSYAVLEAVQEGEAVRFRVPEFIELAEPQLWQSKQPPTRLLVKLKEGIAGLREAGLAHDLAAGRLTAAPSHPPHVNGFTPAQDAARATCLGRGVHLVWGPPGTGKTRVLTEAIDALLRGGKRVLLVSSTNIAVDNALLGAVRSKRHQHGHLLRVGPPHHPGVLEHPDVCLPFLVERQLATVSQERSRIEQRLVLIRKERAELARLENELADFDADAYHRARSAAAAAASVPQLAANLAAEKEASHVVHVRLANATMTRDAAEGHWRDLDAARRAYADIDRLDQEITELVAAADGQAARALQASHAADLIQAEIRDISDGRRFSRFRDRGRLRKLTSDAEQARTRAHDADLSAREAKELVDRQQHRARVRIEQLTTAAGYSRADIRAARASLLGARQELEKSATTADETTSRIDAAQQRLLAAEAASPTEAQRTLLAEAERRDLVTLDAQMRVLRTRLTASEGDWSRLEAEYAKVQEQYTRLSRDAEGEIIRDARLVATTLARLRTSKPLMDGPYDVVLVDEVGAANIPEVLLAVSRATQAAVMFGDFMQLGAIIDNAEVGKADRADVKKWLIPDIFAHCKIFSAEDAERHPGCTMLNVQHRFGPQIMGLANAIAYDGRLKPGESIRPHVESDPEILVVDVDDLGEIGRVRSDGRFKGWWPAGALLARVLSDFHQSRGERTGIVTPYGRQVEATLEALRDHETGTTLVTEVGTAHRFQGREFPIVVFDTVEDEYDSRWMAEASRTKSDFLRDGIRLFNVAITRTQHRLYLIGSLRRIEAAAADTPFGHLAELVRQKQARVIRANRLVTPTNTPEDDLAYLAGSFTGELAELLAQHVRVEDIHDERTFYDVFADHIASARQSIWLWAPWTTTRVRSVLPLLHAAVDRGVRITLFVRDPGDKVQREPEHQGFLADLRAVLHTVVEVNVMHQKIVVIDEHTTLLGSLNVLSQRWTREVMVVMRGAHFARKLLEHEHATVFSRRPPCGVCGSPKVDLRRRSNGNWYWRCYADTCPKRTPTGRGGWTQDIDLGSKSAPKKASSQRANKRS
ncbi:phospholipase [Actinoplanes sp. TBRC 11911]|uniref:AAA domain-containing protein n=1 Tax=Actinoplanes sp. TBRC 11911 TaxID=2729386 RepID=UPI00145EE9A8|nr:AAA domain-containing protein [Actinoplanes sp. TBRC 11911]NMO57865.1 phospholipase [Actinoplanes sp. TBRC 11911]